MQSKSRFLWLALIPIGAAGALATNLIPLSWQAEEVQQTASKPGQVNKAAAPDPAPVKQAALRQEPPAAATEKPADRAKSAAFGIDVARINGDGASVIAGYAKPNEPITVFADDKPIAVVTPDNNGDWVLLTPHKFARLDPKISVKPGDHVRTAVAALKNPTTASGGAGPATPASASRLTATEVTQQMIHRLEKLTSDAQSASTTSASLRPSIVTSSVAAAAAETEKSAFARNGAMLLGAPPAKEARTVPLPSVRLATLPPLAGAQQGKSLPVPVQFHYRTAEFTDQGREAAALLLKYFKAKKFKSVTLSGHADERGSPSANKRLSRQRLDSIRKFLRDGGFKGRLRLLAKGETEKYSGVDRSKFGPEELYQLDRRVEVVVAR